MTPAERIAKALELLKLRMVNMVSIGGDSIELSDEIYALIRAADERWRFNECSICGVTGGYHAPDCALLALCDAINGEGGG